MGSIGYVWIYAFIFDNLYNLSHNKFQQLFEYYVFTFFKSFIIRKYVLKLLNKKYVYIG